MKRLLKIGVLGAGHLGKIHLRCILQADRAYTLAGFYDPNPDTSRETALQLAYRIIRCIEKKTADVQPMLP